MADTTQVSSNTVTAAGHAYDATQKLINDKTSDPRLSIEKAAHVAAEHLKAGGALSSALGVFLSVLGESGAVILDTITKSKLKGQTGLHDLLVAALSDVLQLDISSSDVPVGQGAAGQRNVNHALGGKFVEQLKTFFGASGAVTGDTAEAAAETFVGFNMQFSASVGFLGLLGELFSFGHVKELSEVGEVLERSLGLGRLTRQVLRPYIRNLISEPLDRKMRAQYRQDILGTGELARAIRREGKIAGSARALLAQHGLPDDQIDELVDQTTPRLSVGDLEMLVAYGELANADAVAHAQADGIPASISALMLKAAQERRLQRLREAGLSEVLALIRSGDLAPSALDDFATKFGVPDVELELWRARAGVYEGVRRRRIGKGDMFYLYEHGQVTLDEIASWAEAEGYDTADIQLLQLEVLSKAGGVSTKSPDAIAAAAQHLHNKNVALVKDIFEGAYGRPPSAAELKGWVSLLDTKQRTPAMVKTEAKLNPTPPQQ